MDDMNYNYWEHLKLIEPNHISYEEFMKRWTGDWHTNIREQETDNVTLMTRFAINEARDAVNLGNWAFIKTLGPQVRLYIGRFNHNKDRKAWHKTVSFYVDNHGKIGREEL